MLPQDHIFLPEANALPAIAVVRLPNGVTHFLVVWRRHGAWVQVMDPAVGRRWMRTKTFLSELYIHSMKVAAASWREWAATAEFIKPLTNRLAVLRVSPTASEKLIAEAQTDPEWYSLAVLDAATRLVSRLVKTGALSSGSDAEALIQEMARLPEAEALTNIPSDYWMVQASVPDEEREPQLLLQGALLLRVRPLNETVKTGIEESEFEDALAPDLVDALKEPPRRPTRELLKLLLAEGKGMPIRVGVMLALAALTVVTEALVFWLLINASQSAGLDRNIGLIAVAFLVVCIGLILDWQATNILLKLGLRIESGLRNAFMYKVPRLGDRYFRSRLNSDMAGRSHNLYRVHYFPETLGRMFLELLEVGFTTVAMVWLSPANFLPIVLGAMAAICVPVFAFPILMDYDMRVRTHLGALGRFYFDALLGLVPLRAHSAERALQREFESRLRGWRVAAEQLVNVIISIQTVQVILILSCLGWLLVNVLPEQAESVSVLLLAYWGLRLAFLGRDITRNFQNYLTQRNLTQRLIEPLGAAETQPIASTSDTVSHPERSQGVVASEGVSIAMQGVQVRAAGHTILNEITFEISAGSHVAVIGPSGAGKSSLLGLLLGWHTPATGQILLDGKLLDAFALEQLRQETVWVDPAVQIWNRSLFENLVYGGVGCDPEELQTVIEKATLGEIIASLPHGLDTILGESGGLVSGGEGQRVRLARGMMRARARLVILDEPFRGLDREQRHVLLRNARKLWQNATLIVVTHDVQETLDFDRVLVMEQGEIIEDSDPQELSLDPLSRYSEMLEAERALHKELWGATYWERWKLRQGQVEKALGEQL